MPHLPRLAAGATCALLCATAAFAAPATETRAAFLRLLDRPRVPLAATVQPAVAADGIREQAFSFAADAHNRVPGLLLQPAAALPAGGRRPVVINLHGTGGSKEGQRKLLQELARAGFVAVAIDGRHHGERAPGGKAAKSAAYVDAIRRAWFEPGREYPFFYDTAWDVMRLIDWLVTRAEVDPQRIALWGFSKGGIETYLAAAADPRVAAAVSCIGVQSFGWAADHDAWQSRIGTVQAAFDAAAQDRGVAKPDGAFVRAFYARVAPGIDGQFDGPAMLPLIAPRPFLAINGETDARTPLPGLQLCTDAARAAYRAQGAERNFTVIIQPATGHKVNPDSMQRIHAWLVATLKP
jgi:dienelactone hydrolase